MQVDKNNIMASMDPDKEKRIAFVKGNIFIVLIIMITAMITFIAGLYYGYITGKSNSSKLYIIKDSVTGLNYFVSGEGYVCPRYNWDGSIYSGEANSQDIFIDTRIK